MDEPRPDSTVVDPVLARIAPRFDRDRVERNLAATLQRIGRRGRASASRFLRSFRRVRRPAH